MRISTSSSLISQLRRGNSKKSRTRRKPIRIAASSPLLRGRDGQRRIPFAGEITVQNGLLLRGSRIIVPATLRHEILEKIHTGHLGIVKCRARAQESVWWPGLAEEIKSLVENCDVCKLERPNPVEPMIATESPAYPWHTVGTELFEYSGSQYLLVVDYLSRYPEIAKLEATTSSSVIEHLKSIFGRNGIPKVLRSDNGPQFASGAFNKKISKGGSLLPTANAAKTTVYLIFPSTVVVLINDATSGK